jgi:Tol biopolymer transport system component
VAFLGDSAGFNDLWVYNLITGEKLLVSEDANRDANNHSWSPDGTRIAYQSNKNGNLDVYTFDLIEDDEYRLTNHMGADSSPSWDCSGINVSFTSIRDGDPNIFVIFWKGGDEQNLTIHPATDKWSEWSPIKELASRGR